MSNQTIAGWVEVGEPARSEVSSGVSSDVRVDRPRKGLITRSMKKQVTWNIQCLHNVCISV